MQNIYFSNPENLQGIKDTIPETRGNLGVKVHFGEEGNISYVKADKVKQLLSGIEGYNLIETSVLYRSKRSTAQGHKEVALTHGFDFAPLHFIDGPLGDDSCELPVPGVHFDKAFIGAGISKYESLIVISHFKGHSGSSFGGAIKNISMGLASRRGKLAMHASIKHQISIHRCKACGICIQHCPADAISIGSLGKAQISGNKCISCSKCIAVCPYSAVKIPWGSTGSKELQERLSEYGMAAISGRKCYFINFLTDIVEDCDCNSREFTPLMPDIGILAGTDPVALDQASYDLVCAKYPEFSKKLDGSFQLSHGEKIGLGRRDYKLINI